MLSNDCGGGANAAPGAAAGAAARPVAGGWLKIKAGCTVANIGGADTARF